MLSRKRFATAVHCNTNDMKVIAGKSSTLQCIVSTQQMPLHTQRKDRLALGKVHISENRGTSHTHTQYLFKAIVSELRFRIRH